MAGTSETQDPTYVSLRSAEVILSDIRPVKLKVEALHCVNVLLDEFLYNILDTARSMATDKLRTGLLKVLPSALGKEALLEAEVELRAYWASHPMPSSSQTDQGETFHLNWSFELLQLKCAAYSTLNDSDEDADTEKRLYSQIGHASGIPHPKATLIAPAALYLTAILESVCEHILSNVGRVAARDSSRTSATVNDLFVALCEDHSIYSHFKSMKAYEQIEILSAPKPRRSKSFSRNHQREQSVSRPSSRRNSHTAHSRSRLSVDSSASMATTVLGTPTTALPAAKQSLEKSRAMKVIIPNNRSSSDHGSFGNGHVEVSGVHKKTDSLISDAQQVYTEHHDGQSNSEEFEDESLLQEFDDAMRAGPTMKMSLTPDRLKSMEVYNREKSQRGKRNGVLQNGSSENSSRVSLPATAESMSGNGFRNGKEFEQEGSHPVAHRNRKASLSAVMSKPIAGRSRSVSASTPPVSNRSFLSRGSSREVASSTPPVPGSIQTQVRPVKQLSTSTPEKMPQRTRKVARNRESLDLDDVMGSDDEAPMDMIVSLKPSVRMSPYPVSPGTRDLMEFLATGPPVDPSPLPKMGNASKVSLDTSKSKAPGRLQRMISKLKLGELGERQQQSRPTDRMQENPIRRGAMPPSHSSLSAKSAGSMTLANRPVPPRPPPLVSPPPSPSPASEDPNSATPRSRRPSHARKTVPVWDETPSLPTPPLPETGTLKSDTEAIPSVPLPDVTPTASVQINNNAPNSTPNGQAGHLRTEVVAVVPLISTVRPSSESATTKRYSKATNTMAAFTSPTFSQEAKDMRRLMSSATTAAECRVLVDMFLAKCGILSESMDEDNPYPSPPFSGTHSFAVDDQLENSLVELLLSGHRDSSPTSFDHDIEEGYETAPTAGTPVSAPHTPQITNTDGTQQTIVKPIEDTLPSVTS